MIPSSTSSGYQPIETNVDTGTDGSMATAQPTGSLLKRSASMGAEPSSVPPLKKIRESRDVRREKNRVAAVKSRKKKMEQVQQLNMDNKKLKNELTALRQQLGITLQTQVPTEEQSSHSTVITVPAEKKLPLLLPKPPVVITETELERQKRSSAQPSTSKLSSRERTMIKDRGRSQIKRDAEKIALNKLKTENDNMALEIQSLKKIIEDQESAVSLTSQSAKPSSVAPD